MSHTDVDFQWPKSTLTFSSFLSIFGQCHKKNVKIFFLLWIWPETHSLKPYISVKKEVRLYHKDGPNSTLTF